MSSRGGRAPPFLPDRGESQITHSGHVDVLTKRISIAIGEEGVLAVERTLLMQHSLKGEGHPVLTPASCMAQDTEIRARLQASLLCRKIPAT